jgi:hypothetical protein
MPRAAAVVGQCMASWPYMYFRSSPKSISWPLLWGLARFSNDVVHILNMFRMSKNVVFGGAYIRSYSTRRGSASTLFIFRICFKYFESCCVLPCSACALGLGTDRQRCYLSFKSAINVLKRILICFKCFKMCYLVARAAAAVGLGAVQQRRHAPPLQSPGPEYSRESGTPNTKH